MARLPRLTIGARMLQFAQRKLSTYASSGVTPIPPRVRQRGVRSGEFDEAPDFTEAAPPSQMSAVVPTHPVQRTPRPAAPAALPPPQPRANVPIIHPEATEYAADDPDFQRLQAIMRKHEEIRQEQLRRQAEKQAEHPDLVPKPASNRGIRRRAAFDYVNTEAIRDESAPASPPPAPQQTAAPQNTETSDSDDDSHSAPLLANPPPMTAPSESPQAIQRVEVLPAASDPVQPIQRVDAPPKRESQAAENVPVGLEGLSEVSMLQAFTEVQRSPLPPRPKPYLPPLPPTPDQIVDAAADAEQPTPPVDTARHTPTPTPLPVDTARRDPTPTPPAASDPSQPLDLEDALLRAFAPPSPPQMGPRHKPYLIPSSEEAESPASPPQAQRQATSAPIQPIQRAPAADAPQAPRQRPTSEQARLLNALDLPTDTHIEGSWSAPAPVTIQRAIDAPSTSDPAPEPETASDQEVDPAVVEQLAQKVFRILRSRLRTDRERRDL